ncbi:hypothetical protein Z043_109151 [Scleropages formosus]|uniref:Uncharacterized protein n=1 Tax=Scleropages formosus TaxID=113540 RepID=A0A0P7URK6_SCLFO|nr:hypothetical protein Z043_109151 [Scleropages formosus]
MDQNGDKRSKQEPPVKTQHGNSSPLPGYYCVLEPCRGGGGGERSIRGRSARPGGRREARSRAGMEEGAELSVVVSQVVQRLRGTHLHSHLEREAKVSGHTNGDIITKFPRHFLETRRCSRSSSRARTGRELCARRGADARFAASAATSPSI